MCIKDLARLEKPFKYIVTCIITQNNGSGLQSAACAFWEGKKDGLTSVQIGSQTFFCIVTIFAMAI
jgi:dynein light chain Tctex-type 1